MRYYNFQFRVGGKKTGYDCVIEVRAKNRRAANIRIRNRIRKMPDVATMPEFTMDDIECRLASLYSDGHNDVAYETRTRPRDPLSKPKPPEAGDTERVSLPDYPRRRKRRVVAMWAAPKSAQPVAVKPKKSKKAKAQGGAK